ncbi:MAG: mechanosensitive ion channel, partial [Archangium sp.]|nr:mechanosensitive ion channel [Archangium sp.]
MNFFEVLAHQALEAKTPFLWLAVVAALVAARLSRHAVRFKALVFFAVMHHLLLLIGAALSAGGSPMAEAFEVPALVSGGVAFVGAVGVVVFELALPRMRLSVPPIVQDVVVAVVSILTAVVVASRAGVNLSGIIATSAVITAVLGFSLQDVIASVASGLALQMDSSMEVGDWVQVGDVRGRVSDIRWRFTAIETRNWETVLVPNFVVLRSPVTVLGKRTGHPQLWRRSVTFSVGFNVPPTDVIDVVQGAVRGAGLANVAAEPPPSVIVANLDGSACSYRVRYWLKDFAADDPTDSEVLTRVYFALQRAGLELSLPTQAVHVTEESEERQSVKTQRQVERRRALLDAVPLFSALSPEERVELARSLKYAPFTRGEVMTKQGAEAHWLYLIEEGTASVR